MKKISTSVSKAEWGSAREEFISRLPEILEQHNKGKTRKFICDFFGLKMSYSQFCCHLDRHLKSLSSSSLSPSRPKPSRLLTVGVDDQKPSTISAPERVGGSGLFVMPEVTIPLNDGEDNE